MRAALLLFLILAAAMAFFRFFPVTAESGPGQPTSEAVGDYPKTGGFYAVRLSSEVGLNELKSVILASPRTRELAEGVYVSRSFFWGFPDITHVWVDGDNTHVSTHLVYGRSDLGANQRRVEGWLEALR